MITSGTTDAKATGSQRRPTEQGPVEAEERAGEVAHRETERQAEHQCAEHPVLLDSSLSPLVLVVDAVTTKSETETEMKYIVRKPIEKSPNLEKR